MHDLHAMYKKYLSYLREMFEDDVDGNDNFSFRPRLPKMSDLEIMAFSITAESASIDSENLFFVQLRTDYRDRLPNLVDRTKYNRRRRGLESRMLEYTKRLSMTMDLGSSFDIVDIMPCPLVKNARGNRFRICREDPLTQPRAGYSAVQKSYLVGYKLHLLADEHGIFQDMMVTPANVHDINFMKRHDFETYSRGRTIVGDRGYISAQATLDLFSQYEIKLEVPYRKNQKQRPVPVSNIKRKKRKRIETMFSQLSDQFMIKRNYAKSYLGFLTRITGKLAAMASLQRLNLENRRELNHLKHAWSQ